MTRKIVVGIDGSPSAKRALDYAVERAKADGSTIIAAYVLEWSAYSFLTPDEIEERHSRRREELARAERDVLDPIVKEAGTNGVQIETELKYGHIAETICQIATDHQAAQIVIGRTGQSRLQSRLFGSVAGSLAQAAPAPVTIVP